MKSYVYVLIAWDLSSVGGPMGTEDVRPIFTKYFGTIAKAKAHAEKYYASRSAESEKIEWDRENNCWTTGDLRWVSFEVSKEEIK